MPIQSGQFPALRLITLAAVLGAVVGGIAVYVKGGADGNNAGATSAVAQAADAQCAAKAAKAEKVGAAAVGGVAAMLAADPPRSMSSLTFDGPDGKKLTLADFEGKTLVFNLWATWCAPCRAEMPSLDALEAKKGGEDFQVVAVNVDTGDKAKPEKFLDETGVTHLKLYREPSLDLFNEMKKEGLALGLPVTLLIDDEGCVLTHMNGPAEWAGDDAARLIEAAMKDGA
jgi:thiol-disulfide isomerase/thioredoxin